MDDLSIPVHYPKLRAVDVRPYQHNGEPYYLLEDPLELNGGALLVPQGMGPILALCDGSKADAAAINAALIRRYGYGVGASAIEELLAALDHSFLLENERFERAAGHKLDAFRQSSHRPPILAGLSYPADPDELAHLLDGYMGQPYVEQTREEQEWATDLTDSTDQNGFGPKEICEHPSDRRHSLSIPADSHDPDVPIQSGRGIFSPHIDYPRGGPIYGGVWQASADLVQAADLVVMFATDHYGHDRFTLTRQRYATPYGVLPTDDGVVARLAQAMGPRAAFAGEMRHMREHSVELVAVWLHHLRRENPPALVPILTGGLHDFFHGEAQPDQDATISRVLDTLAEIGRARRVLVVASGDMSHVGPAFGGRPLTPTGEKRLRLADQDLLGHLQEGDGDGFFRAIARVGDRNNVCGLTPFYLGLRLMQRIQGSQARGRLTGYGRCPADDTNTSAVTICGMIY